ncbi:AsmA-like C-terminal domain-containing protein [Sulfurimonas sp.]|uniref:YhdP family protein n=1 Tax=Sulfurimonas sp. TaxID=2022749 RepID=UPI00356B137E
MNDKIIISAILKLHFTIVSALSFIFFTLSLLFILLQNGLYIQNISLPNIQVQKLYIKWNEKLNISIQEIKIVKNSKRTKNRFSIKEVDKFFNALLLFDNWFEKIEINKISFNDIKGSFKYIDGKDGFLVASSKNFSFKSSLFFESHLFNVKIEEFYDYKRNIKINGNIIFDGYRNLELISSLNININNDVKLNAYLVSNSTKASYKIDSNEKIKSLKHTIEMFGMPKEVKYWAYDAIKTSDVELTSVHGWLEYNNLSDAYKNIYVKAVANNLSYTYNKKLEPVTTNNTKLEFKNGVLFIRPKDAYQYGFNLNKSWLKIDFTKKEELLTLFLLFNGKVTKDLIYLLNTYQIKLPFLQNSGNVDTNLKIEVGLRNIDVRAKGDFFTKKANFNYLGLDLDIYNAHVFLDNYDVSIKNMHSKYKDIATADVDVEFNAKKSEGTIDFRVQQVDFKDIGLRLKKSDTPLNISYKISNAQDTINAERSTWLFKDKDVNVEKVTIPFDLKTLEAQIPTTSIDIDNIASAYVSGTFALKPIRADLDVDILNFMLHDVRMDQSSASLKVNYSEKFILTSNDKIRLNANNLDYILDHIAIEMQEDEFRILNSDIEIKDFANAKLSAKYFFNDSNGTIKLKKLKFKNKDFGDIFSSDDAINLDVESNQKKTEIKAKDYNAQLTLKDKEWILKFNSIADIAKKSKLLQDNNITNGDFTLYKNQNNTNIQFLSNIKYPYKILTSQNTPTDNYVLKGEIKNTSKDISLNINGSVDVDIGKEIRISANNTGISIDEVLNYFNDRNSSAAGAKNVIFNANNCYLYISKNRHVVSDNINLQYFNNIVSAQLKYKEGSAGFELKDGKFYLYGDNFSDKFMDNLFALSKFKGGNLSFSMTGTTQEYSGLMYIKDTTVIDYKVLNNILAFVNTIPSLVTFSVPGYSKNGLEVSSAYMNFHTKDDIFNITDISLDSKEMDILGRGTASYKNNSIDVELNLKTDLGSSVSKIPVVGYILLGEDSISTSMKISGKLNDPKVQSLIAKDIAVAPLNIIKRTLLLPFHLFEDDKDKKKD